MLYLQASESIEILDEFKGEKGRFLKTFAFNTQRNNNGWRVTWDSIKRNIGDFKDKPGIEFVKCEDSVCDLYHTEGATYEQSLQIQEDFRSTNIIDFTLDENTETAFFIHKLEDGHDDFWEKVQQRIIKAVSPSIWPIPGKFAVNGINEKGLPIIDAFDWLALHVAFLTKNPAYGDVATITSTCEGENCHMKLLSAKQISATDDDSLAPLQEVSLMVRHKDNMQFVGVTQKVADSIYAKIKSGETFNEKLLTATIKESENNTSDSDSNTSFSSCSCSANSDMTLNPEEIKKLEEAKNASDEKVKDLEAKLKASEGLQKDNDDLKAKLKAADEDKKEGDSDDAVKDVKATNEFLDKENKDLKAKISAPLIAKILKAREERGMPSEKLTALKTSLNAKSISDLEEKSNEDEFMMMTNLTASDHAPSGQHFEFGSEGNPGSLSAKSLESTFNEEDK